MQKMLKLCTLLVVFSTMGCVPGCFFTPNTQTCRELMPKHELYTELDEIARKKINEIVNTVNSKEMVAVFADSIQDSLPSIQDEKVKYIREQYPKGEEVNLEEVRLLTTRGIKNGWAVCTLGESASGNFLQLAKVTHAGQAAYLTYTFDRDKYKKRLVVQLEKIGGDWELIAIQDGVEQFNGYDLYDYFDVYEQEVNRNNYFAAYYVLQSASHMSFKLSNINTGIQNLINQTMETFKSIYKFEDFHSFTANGKEHEFIHGKLYVALDGIAVELKYVSELPLGSEQMQEEADHLYKVVERELTNVKKYFGGVIINAYQEPPTDPNKSYHAYGYAYTFDN